MNIFAIEINLINRNQAGFRKGHSTSDNIYCLHVLISLYLSFGKKLYCTFVDFRKAFDSVWRTGLWRKLQKYEIKGKCFKIIFNLYRNIKSCVEFNNKQSEFFPCLTGVRQGENLSPFLFSIFLNDIEDFFKVLLGSPLNLIKEKCQSKLHIFIEMFVLLYADDTVIFSETPEGMQNALNIFDDYCKTWHLCINVSKTKVVIFSKRKNKSNIEFMLQGVRLEIVDDYSYLGICFKYNGYFAKAKQHLVDQAQKALFSIYQKIRNNSIPVHIQLKLFDSLVEPILLYGSEIWGYENLQIIEKVHLQFCKQILNVKKSTPNFMVYGELGRLPLEIQVKLRMVSFWSKLVHDENKLSSILYKLIFSINNNERNGSKWLKFIKSILDNTGMGYIYTEQYIDFKCYKQELKQKLCDQFIQTWFSDIRNSSRGQFYTLFKTDFYFENYLSRLSFQNRCWITKLRTSNLRLPIETGRWFNVLRENRICKLCNTNIGDEYHYLFNCKNQDVEHNRRKYIPKYYKNNPNVYKMKGMLSLCNISLLKNLAIFIKKLASLLN